MALCNFGTLQLWHFATLSLCNFGTLKLWHFQLSNIGTFQLWHFTALENQSLQISMPAFTHLSVPHTCYYRLGWEFDNIFLLQKCYSLDRILCLVDLIKSPAPGPVKSVQTGSDDVYVFRSCKIILSSKSQTGIESINQSFVSQRI